MGKAAARPSDATAHVLPLGPGPGSLDVVIGGKPAWRAVIDGHLCPSPIVPPSPAPHGAETCFLGSFSVLINRQMAVRKDDLLTGRGAPNSVLGGEEDVQIGDVSFGLADPGNQSEFCAELKALVGTWPTMTRAQRQSALQVIINRQLAKSGLPEVGINPAVLGANTSGELDFPNWSLNINNQLLEKDSLDSSQARALASTVVHEARHAEQWYAIARCRASEPAMTTQQLANDLGIPQRVASQAMANPLSGDGPERIFGETMDRSVYGSQRVHREQVLGDLEGSTPKPYTYDQYRALPEETDAWQTGDALDGCGC